MPLALECLAQMQKVCEQMSIYFRIARPPEAQSLPLISRNVGMVPPGSSMTRLHEFHVRVEGSTMSPVGTKRTWRDVRLMSAFGGNANMG